MGRATVIFYLIFAATVLGSVFHIWRMPPAHRTTGNVVEVCLFHLLFVQWGVGGVLTSVPHIVAPDAIAGFVGWETGSPFQVELGFSSLGTSILGILCFWHRGWFWLAPVVARSVFLLGAAYVHVIDILEHGNLAPGNAGPVLFFDIVIPIIAIGLLIAHIRAGGMDPDRTPAI